MDKRHSTIDLKYSIKLSGLRKELSEALANELKHNITLFKRSKAIRNEVKIVERAQIRNIKGWEKKENQRALRSSELQSKQNELNILSAIIVEKKADSAEITAKFLKTKGNELESTRLMSQVAKLQFEIKKHRQDLSLIRKQIQFLKSDSQVIKELKETWAMTNTLISEAINITPLEDIEHTFEIAELENSQTEDARITTAQKILAYGEEEREKIKSLNTVVNFED